MKSLKWKVFIISGICIALGLVFMISGMILGGSPGYALAYNNSTRKMEIRRSVNGTKNVNKVEKTKLEAFENIDLDVDFMKIDVERADDYYVEYTYAAGEKEPMAKVENNTFIFKQNPEVVNDIVSFFNMGFTVITEEEIYVKLYVPQECEFDRFVVASNGGSVSLEGDYKAKELILASDFGNITAGKLEADQVSFDQNSGKVNVGAIYAKNISIDSDFGVIAVDEIKGEDTRIDSNSGDIKLNHLSGGMLRIYSDFGSVTLADAELSGNIELDVNSGGISLDDITCRDLMINTDFGHIKGGGMKVADLVIGSSSGNVTLHSLMAESVDIETDFGSVELGLEEAENVYSYDLDVDFGTLKINGNKENSSYKKEAQGGKPVRIESNSGSITLTTK